MNVPQSIQSLLKGESYTVDSVGCSESRVLLFLDKVLKIQPCGEEAYTEYTMLQWLQGKLPVPGVLACEEMDGMSWLLMTRLSGKMACDAAYMHQPQKLAELLAFGLKRLWQVDVSGCPVRQDLDRKLLRAEYNIAHGLADFDEPQGFASREALLAWLQANRPAEVPALSHGDFCLPNVFFDGDAFGGCIDLSRCGVADKWCDIALCYRSLRDNFAGKYGQSYPGYSDALLFDALGIAPDWEKIRYYILLDELF